jgi:hypothetical protein
VGLAAGGTLDIQDPFLRVEVFPKSNVAVFPSGANLGQRELGRPVAVAEIGLCDFLVSAKDPS